MQFSLNACQLIEINAWENEKLVAIKTLQEWKKESKKGSKKRENKTKRFGICGQCTNACANCDGKDNKNHASLSQF